MTRARIVFTPAGLAGDVEIGTSVLDAARTLGADLDSVCGGRAICGHCQVLPGTGTFAKWAVTVAADAVSAPGRDESTARLARPLASGHRLGCRATILADTVIDIPAASQVHRPVVRKEVDLDDLRLDPTVTLAYVEVPATTADRTRLTTAVIDALKDQHGVAPDTVSRGARRDLHTGLTGDPRAGTVVLRHCADGSTRLDAIVPGFTDRAFGIAIDVGSTTIAGHLCDLTTGEVLASAGRMNPQIRYGEDVMSRVSYVMLNPGGATALTATVRDAMGELGTALCAAAAARPDEILDLVVVGNPIMHHLVLGIDPTPLGTAPFELATDGAVTLTATELELPFPHAEVYCAPCIAGHVGADTAAAMVSERTADSADVQLLVDIGTNAEIALGTPDGVWAASSPTGPAFEGAQISCGQRATVGAIEAVRVDPTTLAPAIKVIGCDAWSDEPGFDASAPTVTGLCGSGIVDAIAQLFLAGVITADGTIRTEAADSTDFVVRDGRTAAYVLYEHGATRVALSQNDVRAIQLAKAALRAGIDLVLEHAGIEQVDEIRLAGAFGAHIDPVHAMVLGLIPDTPVTSVRSVGNAAGAGAVRLLLSAEQRRSIEAAVLEVTKIETATEPRFQELFVAAMALPHAAAPNPRLAEVVALPVPRPAARARRRARRRPSA